MKKIGDFPWRTHLSDLIGKKVKTSDGKVGYIKSFHESVIWLSASMTEPTQVCPIYFSDFTEVLEWNIVNEKTPINL